MDTVTWVQTLNEPDCISLSTNIFEEAIDLIILSSAMGK